MRPGRLQDQPFDLGGAEPPYDGSEAVPIVAALSSNAGEFLLISEECPHAPHRSGASEFNHFVPS